MIFKKLEDENHIELGMASASRTIEIPLINFLGSKSHFQIKTKRPIQHSLKKNIFIFNKIPNGLFLCIFVSIQHFFNPTILIYEKN